LVRTTYLLELLVPADTLDTKQFYALKIKLELPFCFLRTKMNKMSKTGAIAEQRYIVTCGTSWNANKLGCETDRRTLVEPVEKVERNAAPCGSIHFTTYGMA